MRHNFWNKIPHVTIQKDNLSVFNTKLAGHFEASQSRAMVFAIREGDLNRQTKLLFLHPSFRHWRKRSEHPEGKWYKSVDSIHRRNKRPTQKQIWSIGGPTVYWAILFSDNSLFRLVSFHSNPIDTQMSRARQAPQSGFPLHSCSSQRNEPLRSLVSFGEW